MSDNLNPDSTTRRMVLKQLAGTAGSAVLPVLGKDRTFKNHGEDSSLPHERESGAVTASEMATANQWRTVAFSNAQPRTDWVADWISGAFPFHFTYNSQDSTVLFQKWQFQRSTAGDRDQLVWDDSATGLRVTWSTRSFSDYPAQEWLLEFENRGESDTPIIEDVQALDLRLKGMPGEPYSVHAVNGGRSLPDDMIPFTRQIPSPDGWHRELVLGDDYPSSNRHLPFFNIETPGHKGVIVGIGWSGCWLARISAEKTSVWARAGLSKSHFILRPGEVVRSPRILALFWEGERLHGSNEFRRLLHQHYTPKLRGDLDEPLVSVNTCFTYHGKGGFLHQATEETLVPLIKPFSQLGAEIYIIDAGWYDGQPWNQWQGNWVYSRSKYPRGMRPLSNPLRAADMIFGLWFASEAVNDQAPVLRDHPEWVRAGPAGRGGTLRMELPQAREWFLKQVDDLVQNQGMGGYRQDGSGWFGEEPTDRVGITESEHFAGLYNLWDSIVERHPQMIMEGCSGGGRRIDLETVSRFHWHQKADRWYDSESDQCSLYGANMFLPGGLINVPTEGTDDYSVWSSFGGQLCLAWHPLDKDFPTAQAKRQVDRYKRIRPLLPGDFYPLTPCSLDASWIAYQFHRSDLDKGFALVFHRPEKSQNMYLSQESFSARLRGLDPENTYSVRFESTGQQQTLRGSALRKGIELQMPKARTAELITYEVK